MKSHDNGAFYSVTISPNDVSAFKDNWPCSGLPEKRIWAQFDKRNGDLVDITPGNLEDRGADGSAVLALLEDAQQFAIKSLNIAQP